ncbi:MAG TPA: MYXO-CTERM sorting domain-containing protein, partial [Polyangia bacterium]
SGAGGTSTGGAAARGGAGGASGAGGATDGVTMSGCGCATARAPRAGGSLWLAAALALAAISRRRPRSGR